MNLRTATLIALCGNAAVFAIHLLSSLGLYHLWALGVFMHYFILLAGSGTLLLFLFTLYRKQP